MALTLLAGPANAGKVALLLERYLSELAHEPFLIVPNRSDVDRVERDLLASSGALLGGEIGTFDDLFRRLARDGGEHRPVATDAQRALIVRRALGQARLNGWTRSARFAGFADALSSALGELESGLVDPGELDGDLAGLYAEYRAELDRLGLWDRDLERRAAAERLAGELGAWERRPVFAYGFEDLTGAQWALLEALAGRAEVTVSLPYEPGRPAFASLERTAADLSSLARPRIEELPPRPEVRPPALAHLERSLFSDERDPDERGVALDGALRAVETGERTEEETMRLRDGHPLPPLELLRKAQTPLAALRDLSRFMLRAAHGLESPPVGEESRQDLRAFEALTRLVDELEGWLALGGSLTPDEIVAAVERVSVRAAGAGEAGRVDVVDLLRARTRRYEVVFVLGLEEGTLPRRGETSPFFDEETARELDSRLRRSRLAKPDAVARDRYLFYTACTRATRRLYLVREAANDEGGPREASPFWDEVRDLFSEDEVRRATTRRPLSALTWPVEQAPTERERLRAVASLAALDEGASRSLAPANGWERRLDRALRAFERPTRLTHPLVLEELRAKTSFGVTELETFADCSSIWFVDRLIGPRTIDQVVDPRLRGQVAHSALHKFFAGVPKRLGVEKLGPEQLDDALEFVRECLAEAMAGVRMELTDLQRRELEQGLLRDLEAFLRDEAA